MSVWAISISYITTLLISIFLALGMTSLLYWVNDRAVSPFIEAHRNGIIRVAGLVYLGVLYALQDMQYKVDPQMHVFGYHWPFLNLMLISLYVIAVRTGDWVTILIQELCCGVYLWQYAHPSVQILIAYVVWAIVLCGLIVIRQKLQERRLWDYLAMLALGLSGIIGIYVSQPRIFDLWWWVRDLSAYVILILAVDEYIRLTVIADTRTGQLQRVAAYEQLTSTAVFARNQGEMTSLFNVAQKNAQTIVVAALDVDHFNEFNQQYGYLTGNIVLLTIADIIQDVVKQAGVEMRLYRSGGEEFTVIFMGVSARRAAKIVGECLARVAKTQFPVHGGYATVTMSAGITTTQQEDANIGTVFARADDNLRVSKQCGRNRMNGNGVDTTNEAPSLKYFAQPIVERSGETLEIWGAELLLRQQAGSKWHLPEYFDLRAEQQIALIREVLDRSLLRRVTINLTPGQFADTGFARALASYVSSGHGPEQLIVEITMVPDVTVVRRITAIYRSVGIKVFIDDVGSDNSYEFVEKILPYIDGVKFAMQNLRKRESVDQIHERIRFWINTAKQANINFILEGVENQADLDFGHHLDIEHYQGYFFGKPNLPAELALA
ncbi:GGDEF and EAL domain-containing protein [Lacticaseibacillus hulanensis]|uniref:GGDEF and EAL domain-containing protein n=1 Tax=Lacticaseibacillus hulanensis TaxID=2493111 RepID=UPI000FD7202C|nr:GGDEF and EAL domain-containing protein [Lacticaseibacillus hulanensis]